MIGQLAKTEGGNVESLINLILKSYPRLGLDPEHEPDLTKILDDPEAWEEIRTKVKEVWEEEVDSKDGDDEPGSRQDHFYNLGSDVINRFFHRQDDVLDPISLFYTGVLIGVYCWKKVRK